MQLSVLSDQNNNGVIVISYQAKQSRLNIHSRRTRELTQQGKTLKEASEQAFGEIVRGEQSKAVDREYKRLRGGNQ